MIDKGPIVVVGERGTVAHFAGDSGTKRIHDFARSLSSREHVAVVWSPYYFLDDGKYRPYAVFLRGGRWRESTWGRFGTLLPCDDDLPLADF
jgi:hypothetical protein